jgi:4-diphosphocytidyl-2-C-methyl-D-erythritol kinase
MAARRGPLRETAYAKINLALHVRERLTDGYHRLESLFAFAQHGDTLEIAKAGVLRLEIDGPFAEKLEADQDNLVLRAAEALRSHFGLNVGAEIRLTKNLPVAAGIGGGSADAAAALRGLVRCWGLVDDQSDVMAIAAELGADVPACFLSETCLGEGRGDALTMLANNRLTNTPLLLVNPGVAVATGPIFQAWDGVDRGALSVSEPIEIDTGWRNDLRIPACQIVPEIDQALDVLDAQDGVTFVRMSGSGATCFALFERTEQRDRASEAIRTAFPQWWQMLSFLR